MNGVLPANAATGVPRPEPAPAGVGHVLRQCVEQGVKLSAVDGELRLHYHDVPPGPALLSMVREYKALLLRHFTSVGSGIGDAVARLDDGRRTRVLASPAQRRMALIDQLDPDAPAYNMVAGYRLAGPVDWAALEAALNDVVTLHEALRSRYETVDGEVWQVVEPAHPVAWEREDLSRLPPAEREAEVLRRLDRENNRRFELERAPLIRASALRLEEGLHVLLLTVHHIACDGWSVEVIKRDLCDRYGARRAGATGGGRAPRIQYVDFCEWQRHEQGSGELEPQLEFWAAQLESVPNLHGLPLDRPRPARQGNLGRKLRRMLGADALADLRQQCQAHGVTPFMYLQTAISVVLALYSNERDLVIGTPVAGRRHGDLADTVGLFVNTLPLRVRIAGNPSFPELLAANKASILKALDNQDVPFDLLVERARVQRSRAHGPLVQIMFTMQNPGLDALALEGLAVEPLGNPNEPVKFDLQLAAQETDGQLQVEWHFNAELFAEASVARMADCLMRLLGLVVAHPATPVFCLPLQPLVPEQPAPAVPAPVRTERLEVMFAQAARANPGQAAVVLGEHRMSYGELDQRATTLAGELQRAGAGPGGIVALHMHRTPGIIVGMLAALKAGAAYLPLDPVHPQARLQSILQDSGASVLVTQAGVAGQLDVGDGTRIELAMDAVQAGPGPVPGPVDPAAGQAAYVLYTSGTTGMPKGVVVGHAGVANLLRQMDALAPLTLPWNGSLWSSVGFDVSVYEIFSALCRGGTLHIVPDPLRLDPERLFQWMQDSRISSAFMHAGYLDRFQQHVQEQQGGRLLRRLLVGVEPIPVAHVAAAALALPGLRLVNGYGPTEATVCCTLFPFGRVALAPDEHLPIGQAVDGLALRIMNSEGHPAPDGAVGELYVGGVGLAIGYLRRPELDRTRFIVLGDGPEATRFYRTGDLVRCRADGELEFLGRVDEQVKIRGFRIELGEVETRLCQLPEVGDAVVIAVGDGAHRQLVGYVVAKRGQDALAPVALPARLRQELRRFLPEYMVPACIVVVDAIPLNASGKVQRDALPEARLGGFDGGTEVVAARDTTEARLLALWKEVLGEQDIGVTHDFFASGGQSLLATRLVGRVRGEFGLEKSALTLGDVLENPTVEALAQTVAVALAAAAAQEKARYLDTLQAEMEEGSF